MRVHALFWLSLLLLACDKVPKEAGKHDMAGPEKPRRASRAGRPAGEEPVVTREQLLAQLQQARAIVNPEERNQAVAAAVWEAFDLDPELSREGFQELIDGSAEKNRLIQHFAMRLAEQNAEEALRWAASMASDEDKSLAYGNIAVVLAEKEPERAADLLSDSGIAGRDCEVAVVQVVQRWAAESPEKAAAWVARFDAGQARSAGLRAVVAAWTEKDPQAAMNWIDSLQDPTIRREAVTGMEQIMLDQPMDRQSEWLRLAPSGLRSDKGK